MSHPAVEFAGVTRTFGKTVAVDSLNLAVEPGTVLGLVGRNGAGKTTTLRLAHGILFPDSGRIRVLGLDPVTDGCGVRRRVRLLSEEAALYPFMTVREIFGFASGLHPGWDPELAESLRERLGLDPDSGIKTLSRGTRAKVALALAVACRPEVLLLDDPTAGLDPLVRREVLEGILEAVPAEGGAVVYASHLIHDVERVADRVAVLDEGRLVLEGSLEEIKGRIRLATAVFDEPPGARISPPGTIDERSDGRVLQIVAESDAESLSEALRRAGASKVETEALSLEEILVACLRRSGNGEADHA